MGPVWMVLMGLVVAPDEGKVEAALRRWATPGRDRAEQAARKLLVLYNELSQDQGLPAVARGQLRARVRIHLARLADQIEKRLAQQRGGEPKPPAKIVLPPANEQHLAQLGGLGRRAGGRMRGGRPGQAGIGPWGPTGAGVAGRQGAGLGVQDRNPGPADYGDQLVDLIRRTIAPSAWDVNGGPGTLYYWRPGRALVVRQTTEVHEDIADLLEQLHRLDR